jgi:hypothetical protein
MLTAERGASRHEDPGIVKSISARKGFDSQRLQLRKTASIGLNMGLSLLWRSALHPIFLSPKERCG